MKCEQWAIWPGTNHPTATDHEKVQCRLERGHDGWHKGGSLTWPDSAAEANQKRAGEFLP